MAMDERKQRVLRAIVSLYSVEGEPVGSSVLANYFDMAVSSATLRNEMAALTRLGLLEQPHTSAGRVPSAKGYRYYIDHLLDDSQPLDRVARARVDSVFASLDHEPDRLAQGAVKALAQMSGYTAAVSTPCADDLCIAHFEVVQVGRNAAAILAVTSAGYVRTRVARVREGLTREKAAQLASLLNWPQLEGKVQTILTLLNDEAAAARLIAAPAEGASVLLGEDMEPRIPGLSVVSCRYLVGGGLYGSVALVGPTRMPFSKVIPLLETFADELGEGMAGKRKDAPQAAPYRGRP